MLILTSANNTELISQGTCQWYIWQIYGHLQAVYHQCSHYFDANMSTIRTWIVKTSAIRNKHQ